MGLLLEVQALLEGRERRTSHKDTAEGLSLRLSSFQLGSRDFEGHEEGGRVGEKAPRAAIESSECH